MNYMYNCYTNAIFFIFPSKKNVWPNYSQIWISAARHTGEFSSFYFFSTQISLLFQLATHDSQNKLSQYHSWWFTHKIFTSFVPLFEPFGPGLWHVHFLCPISLLSWPYSRALYLSASFGQYLPWVLNVLWRANIPQRLLLVSFIKCRTVTSTQISFGDPRLSTSWDLSSLDAFSFLSHLESDLLRSHLFVASLVHWDLPQQKSFFRFLRVP